MNRITNVVSQSTSSPTNPSAPSKSSPRPRSRTDPSRNGSACGRATPSGNPPYFSPYNFHPRRSFYDAERNRTDTTPREDIGARRASAFRGRWHATRRWGPATPVTPAMVLMANLSLGLLFCETFHGDWLARQVDRRGPSVDRHNPNVSPATWTESGGRAGTQLSS